jgi:exodeoxyribonuclease V alpha subunit
VGERIFREGDRVIHRRNNYELGVFNGDIGVIRQIDNEQMTCVVAFPRINARCATSATTSWSWTWPTPSPSTNPRAANSRWSSSRCLTQHFKMLFRNLIYTGLTRARKLAVLVGTRRALAMAVRNQDTASAKRRWARCWPVSGRGARQAPLTIEPVPGAIPGSPSGPHRPW